MLRRTIIISALLFGAFTGGKIMAQDTPAAPKDTLVLELSNGGKVTIAMRPDKAPGHVARIRELAGQGFYNNTVFHRVIDGFMAQGGDPTGTGMSGSKLPDLKAEFNDLPHVRGTVSMARTNDPNSANSQFFIVFEPSMWLDGQYTVWGRVTDGMDAVDSIERGEPPANPTKILKAYTLGQ
jgi:peptidylprolyl isomerase